MESEALLKMLVMDAIANDYENFETIAGEVTSWATEAGLSTNPDNIFAAVKSLIESGLAKAYLLSPNSVEELQAPADIANPSCYYLLTPRGRQILDQQE